METEIKTSSNVPVKIEYSHLTLSTYCEGQVIHYSKYEAIELRNFLNQLNLGDKKA